MTILELIQNEEPLEPETLDILYPELSTVNRQKIFVARILLHTNYALEDMDVFEDVVQVLNNINPDMYKTEGVRPEWIWKALKLMQKIRPNLELSEEVKLYIRFIHKNAGIRFYPEESGIENTEDFDRYRYIANNGPFPLQEDTPDNIQALHYLKIQKYLEGDK